MADYWEIAVAVELENPHFRHTNRFNGSGDWLDSSNLDNVSLETDAGETDLSDIVDPSSFTENISIKNSSGEVVNKKISSVGASTITLQSAMDSAFNQTDLELFGYGKNMPGGWYGGIYSKVIGDIDNFGVSVDAGDLHQSLDSKFFYSGVTYRLVGVVSADTNSGKDGSIEVVADGGGQTLSTNDVSDTAYTLVQSSGSISAESDFDRIGVDKGKCSEIGLEFAYNPLVNREISSGGYYQFPTYADENSVSWSINDATIFGNRNSQSVYQFDPTGQGERNEKITLTASFSKVPLSFYQKLREFERIQKNGFYLNLHPYGYAELPKIITGKIKLSNKEITRSIWDLNRVDFDIEFIQK
jgi:hypothetical protein